MSRAPNHLGAPTERSGASTSSSSAVDAPTPSNPKAADSTTINKSTGPAPIKIPSEEDKKQDTPRAEANGSAGPKPTGRRQSESQDQPKKLPAERLLELASTPTSIPIHVQEDIVESPVPHVLTPADEREEQEPWQTVTKKGHNRRRSGSMNTPMTASLEKPSRTPLIAVLNTQERPPLSARTASTPIFKSKTQSSKTVEKPAAIQSSEGKPSKQIPPSLEIKPSRKESARQRAAEAPLPSPMPTSVPLPPISLSTYLQLELSSSDPSPLYLYRPSTRDFPYEPSVVKLERLINFLLLPPQLEQTLWFGTLACLDAWLYTFTILPLRFCRALALLLRSVVRNVISESKYVASFIYFGIGRVWRRRRLGEQGRKPRSDETPDVKKSQPNGKPPQTPRSASAENVSNPKKLVDAAGRKASAPRHLKSQPSDLSPMDKADILKGLLIISSCIILTYFDASMMYHTVRGQAAIKLYVIYNALEVFDRLLASIGQDVLECLFSKEALERRPDGRSKVIRPLWMFLLALVYNITHAIALFYQVITLNVAVNSYSNALLTLLMSNQFVEIKSTVFKRIEKENLFQMTCADIVERFQLWLTLMIIASRNVIETNNLFGDAAGDANGGSSPLRTSSLLPSSFTLLPSWAGQVMGPFFLVLGIEMLVDWVKHAYITKFNTTQPSIYGRFLDVLAKDYYGYAFAEQNLTKRLGLPVIPLSCLFIRASVQTYQMFLATHLPLPLASPATSLEASSHPAHSPASTAEMLQLPQLLRRALGRHVPADAPATTILHIPYLPVPLPSADTLIAWISTGVLVAIGFAVLLACKLALSMALLAFARKRYVSMKSRENDAGTADGRRIGGWGTVEVDEDKRRWIYEDDPEGLKKLRERAQRERERDAKGRGFGGVERYSMVAKRIW